MVQLVEKKLWLCALCAPLAPSRRPATTSSLFLPPWCERLPYAMAAHGRMRPIRLRGSLAWVMVEVAAAGFNKIFSLTYLIKHIYTAH